MRLFFTPLLALLCIVVPALADFNQIAKDGVAIVNDLNSVYDKLQAFAPAGGPGPVGPALDISNATSQLSKDLETAAADIRSTPSLNEGQGNFLANSVANLQPLIYKTLDLLNTKYVSFNTVAGGIPAGAIVYKQLQGLQDSINDFAAALIPKLSRDLQRVAPLLTSDINFHIDRSLELYKPGGN